MSRADFVAASARRLFERHRLASFEALWALELDAVDSPNTGRGGWSSVSRLELADEAGRIHAFYLKRQIDHLSRGLLRPLGEATFAREFRNIQEYVRLGIPALDAAYFAERRIDGKTCALLVTRALDDYRPLDAWLDEWHALAPRTRRVIIDAVAMLVRTLHEAGRLHNCLYPKHVFVRLAHGGASARLIDLEKTRPLLLGPRDRARDLDTLHRRARAPSAGERLRFFLRYLGLVRLDPAAKRLARRVLRRRRAK